MNLTPYYILTILSLLYLVYRYRGDRLAIFIILICFHGVFAYYGKNIENAYKVVIALYAAYLFSIYRLARFFLRKDWKIILVFAIFSISFFLSAFLNSDPFILTLSQYFSKFLVVFLAFFIFKRILLKNPAKFETLSQLFRYIIVIQIVLSIVKYATVGLLEGVVGSLSSAGGAIATTFPVYAILIIWLQKRGRLNRNDWLIILGTFAIGFSSDKRAIWFILPVMLFIILVYIPKIKLRRNAALIAPLLLMIFYLGVRLNPSLNPERKIWGSFDYNYMMDYTTNYSLGGQEYQDDDLAYGRVSSTFYLLRKIILSSPDQHDLFGIGQNVTRSTDYVEFLKYDTGLGTKMALNGFYRSYISTGYFGIITICLWFIFALMYVRHKRFRHMLLLFITWDYFFYHGNSMDSVITMIMLMYLVWSSNYFLTSNAFAPYSIIRNPSPYGNSFK